MAHSNRLTKRYLEHLVSDNNELYKQGLEPLLRYLDANAPLSKRIGYSVSPKQDALRLGQTPLLHFHSSAFTGLHFNKVNGNYKLKNAYWGMLGINGPLPTHITEYAIERIYRHKDDTLAEFLDIFNHRFLSLFYRAWADAQPAVSHDRPEADTFKKRISVFAGGLDDGGEASTEFGVPLNAGPYLAGLFSQKSRSASSLKQVLSEYLGHDVSIEEFEGAWYTLQKNEQCQLGVHNAGLGTDCILGQRTYQRCFNFSIVIGPLLYDEYIALLSNNERFAMIKRLATKMVGAEYSFSIKLALAPQQSRPSYLGEARLGINAWCQRQASAQTHLHSRSQSTSYSKSKEQLNIVYERAS